MVEKRGAKHDFEISILIIGIVLFKTIYLVKIISLKQIVNLTDEYGSSIQLLDILCYKHYLSD